MPLFTLIPLLGFILLWRRAASSSAAVAALHATAAVLLILYISSLAGLLRPAAWLLLGTGSIIAIYEISLLVRRNSVFAVPIGVWLILAGLVWFVHGGGGFAYYDEFAHWGIYIKEMLATHQLWDGETNAMHLRYVPGPPLWQYLFLTPGGPLEGGAYLAQFCLLSIPLLILWQRVSWKQVPWMIGILLLVVIAVSNFGHGFASLYVDHVLGAWFAGTLFCFLSELDAPSPRRRLFYVLPVATIVLLKDAGLYFALAATGIMALLVFWKRAFEGDRRRIGRGLRSGALLAAVGIAGAVLVTASWNMNRDALQIPSSKISIGGILSGIAAGESDLTEEELAELGRRYRDVVLDQQISKNEVSAMYNAYTYGLKTQFTDRFRLTTASAIVLFVVWQIIVVSKLASPGQRARWAIMAVGMLATLLLYLLVLSLSYRFAFDERALSLSSYLRYVHTALLPMLLLVFLPLLPAFRGDDEEAFQFADGFRLPVGATIFVALLAVLYVVETPYLKPVYTAHEPPPIHTQLEPLSARIAGVVGDDRLWIYFPVPDSNGLIGRILKYQMAPVRTEVAVDPAMFADRPELMQALVSEWDYLWFPVPSPELDRQLQLHFGEDLKERLFRVDRQGDGVTVTALDGIF